MGRKRKPIAAGTEDPVIPEGGSFCRAFSCTLREICGMQLMLLARDMSDMNRYPADPELKLHTDDDGVGTANHLRIER